MAIKLVETAIRPTTIRLRYADADDPAAATEWIDLHFAAKDLKHPKSGNGDAPDFVEVGEAGIAVDYAMRRQRRVQLVG